MGVNVAELQAEIEVTGLPVASTGLAGFGKQIDATAAKQGLAAKQSMSHDQALRKVGTAGLIAGGLLVAGFGVAVGAATSFDKEMSNVAAVSETSAKGMDKLRDAAIEAGAATAFSAGEAAEAEAELAKAGVGVADILGGALRGSLDLAAAGQLELADAATITAQSLNIFNLGGGQASHVADVLTAGANKAAAEVAGLGLGLQSVGNIASTAGISLEETVGTLALFSQNALNGERAGTTLRSMLVSLQSPTDEARAIMDELGISAYDNQGAFVGLADFAGQLKGALSGLTQEQRDATLATLFSTYGLNAANILYKEGEAGVRKWTEAVDDQGAASRMAGTQLDNLSGDLEELRGSIETALIQGGSQATASLRGLTQGAAEAVNWFSALPDPVQRSAVSMGLASSAGLLLVGAIGTLAPKITTTIAAGRTLAATMGFVSASSRGAAGGVAAAGTASSVTAGQMTVATGAASRYSAALAASKLGVIGVAAAGSLVVDELRDASESFYAAATGSDAAGKGVRLLGSSMMAVTGNSKPLIDDVLDLGKGLLGFGDSQEKAADKTKKHAAELGPFAKQQKRAAIAQTELADAVAKYGPESEEAAAATARYEAAAGDAAVTSGALASAEQGLAGATGELGSEAEQAADELDQLKSVLDELLGVSLSAEQASIRWHDSLAGVTAAVYENGLTLDVNTDQGRRNRDAMLGSIEAAQGMAESALDQGAATEFASATLGSHIDQLAGVMRQAGYTEEQVVSYFENVLKIPESARTNITNTSDIARYLVGLYQAHLDAIPSELDTEVNVHTARAHAALDGVLIKLHQLGGGGQGIPADFSPALRLPPNFSGVLAHGGPAKAGASYFVGEKGVELFQPDVDGTIVPNHVLRNSIPAPAPIAVSPPGQAPAPFAAAGPGAGAQTNRNVTNNYEFNLQSLDPRELAHVALNEIALAELARAGDL